MNLQTKTQIKIWGISGLLSMSSLLIGYQYGKAIDCRPDQIDGQCGLGTAVGIIYGVFGTVLIMICTISYSIYRRKRDSNHN
jgi:hypothetical protein